MTQNAVAIELLESQLMELKIERLFQQAYEKGLEDGRSKYNYPPVLTNQHLTEILQIKLPTVNKIVSNPTFPRLKEIRARYPRDDVFQWIRNNTELLEVVR